MTGPDDGPGGSDRGTDDSPTDLPKPAFIEVLKGAFREFNNDNLVDIAAALTYYAVLSIFPALLVVVAVVGLAGEQAVTTLVDELSRVIPTEAQDILRGAISDLESSERAGLTAVLGLLGALWSASGFVAAFIRASNTIFDVPECRPMWKVIPLRLILTLVLLVLLAASALIVVLTGGVARWVQDLFNLPATTVTAWNIGKWPVLFVLLMLILALLYWASPNARQPGFRWVTPGGVLGVLLWLVASALFSVYVANFASYNRVYGALAGVIVFLIWIWVSNLAILFGAEFDAELQRARAHARGLPKGKEPYLELRDK